MQLKWIIRKYTFIPFVIERYHIVAFRPSREQLCNEQTIMFAVMYYVSHKHETNHVYTSSQIDLAVFRVHHIHMRCGFYYAIQLSCILDWAKRERTTDVENNCTWFAAFLHDSIQIYACERMLDCPYVWNFILCCIYTVNHGLTAIHTYWDVFVGQINCFGD